MSAYEIAHAKRFFQVDLSRLIKTYGLSQAFLRHIDIKVRICPDGNRHACAVDRNAVPDCHIIERQRARRKGECDARLSTTDLDRFDGSDRCDDTGEHS